MAGEQDVIQLPCKFFDYKDVEGMSVAVKRNFAEIERYLGLLQGYVKQAVGGAVKNIVPSAGVWDRAANINPDGTFPTEKLTEKLVGLQHALQLADEAVTEAKIAVGAIRRPHIADGSVNADKIADAAITAIKLAQGAVDASKFADDVRPVQLVDSLPTLPDQSYPVGSVVFNRSDGKLYRNVSGAWTSAVEVSDIDGTIPAEKLNDTLVGLNHALQLADQAVTEAKVAVGAIKPLHIQNGSIPVVKTNFPYHQLY